MASRTPSSRAVELAAAEQQKEALIRAACEHGRVATLVGLATSSSGLVSDTLRRTACTSPGARMPPRH